MICRHEKEVSHFDIQRLSINRDLHLAFEHKGQSIKGSRMLAQSLAFIESEQGDCPGITSDKDSADNRTFLVIDYSCQQNWICGLNVCSCFRIAHELSLYPEHRTCCSLYRELGDTLRDLNRKI